MNKPKNLRKFARELFEKGKSIDEVLKLANKQGFKNKWINESIIRLHKEEFSGNVKKKKIKKKSNKKPEIKKVKKEKQEKNKDSKKEKIKQEKVNKENIKTSKKVSKEKESGFEVDDIDDF